MATKIRGEHVETGVWRSQSLTIEYSLQVLEELRMAAEEGFQKIPHGGLEVGALLLGSFENGVLKISEWREITCEHSRGPGFTLSENEITGISTLMDQCAYAPELAGLVPVGWFHTHTRSRLYLSAEDISIHNRLFPEPWQVAMVMRVGKDQPPRVGFFPRPPDGSIHGETPVDDFAVHPNTAMAMRPRRVSAPPLKPSPSPSSVPRREPRPDRPRPMGFDTDSQVSTPPPVPVDMVQYPEMPAELLEEPPNAPFRWRLFGLIGVLLGLACVAIVTRPYWPIQPRSAVGLRVEENGDELMIRWDHNSAPVRTADRGVLQISDGKNSERISLGMNAVRRGTVTYVGGTDDVEVRLTLYEGGEVRLQELARFLGSPEGSRKALTPQKQRRDAAELRTARESVLRLTAEEKERQVKLHETIRSLENQVRVEDRRGGVR